MKTFLLIRRSICMHDDDDDDVSWELRSEKLVSSGKRRPRCIRKTSTPL